MSLASPFLSETSDQIHYKRSCHPCGRHSYFNPCTYFSTPVVRAFQYLSSCFVIGGVYSAWDNHTLLVEHPTDHDHREDFMTSLRVGTAGVGVALFCNKTLSDREMEMKERTWTKLNS